MSNDRHVPRQRAFAFPRHTFQTDGDEDVCTYTSRHLMCGGSKGQAVHMPEPATMGTKMHETIENYVRTGKTRHGATETMVSDFFRGVEKLVAAKDAHYGAAWRRQGYMGNLARILGKADRLRNMAWRDEQQALELDGGDETVCDTVRDLAALCAMFEANLLSGNRWGENA